MICSKEGIRLKKPEAVALLAYAAKPKDKDRPHLAVVHFLIEGDRCWAYATNGHRAIECDGESDGKHHGGEWLVDRKFLDDAAKVVSGNNTLLLCFSGASLTHASVRDEMDAEVKNFGWPGDAASSQRSFPEVRKIIKIPEHKKRAKCVTLSSEYMADLKKVALAANRTGIDLYPPEKPDAPLYFRVQADVSTTWTGVIMPIRSDAAEADDEDVAAE